MNTASFGLTGLALLMLLLVGCAQTGPQETAVEPVALPETALPETDSTQRSESGEIADSRITPTDAQRSRNYYAVCGGQVREVGELLRPFVDEMVGQGIPYSVAQPDEWRDCSGNFLRLSSYLVSACAEQAEHLAAPAGIGEYRHGADNSPPGRPKARTTGDLARWYSQQGRFVPIFYDGAVAVTDIPADLHKHRHLVRPGAVLWFANERPMAAGGLEAIFKSTGGLRSHAIHMATVTAVTRDDAGAVVSFSMYHGRSTGKPGAETTTQYWQWPSHFTSRGQSYPSFGHWNQYLIGIGRLLPDAADSI